MVGRRGTLLAVLCVGAILAFTAVNYSSFAPLSRTAKNPSKSQQKNKQHGAEHAHRDLKFYILRGLRGLEWTAKIGCGCCILGSIKACSGLVASTKAAAFSPGLLALLGYAASSFGGPPPTIVAVIVFFGAKAKAAKVATIATQVASANLAAMGASMFGLLAILFEVAANHMTWSHNLW